MRKTALISALAAALPASAVTLNPDGLGQALIYPYYTVQSAGSDAYNTYISVVNHSAEAKALRVRFREGRMGKEALSLNLYLSPNDVWAGAVVPFATGTRLITGDRSCIQPRFAATFGTGEAPFYDFRNDAFSGANDDGAGAGLDRTREGFVEILEMGKLTGAAATAVTHNSAGVPSNCAALASITPLVEAPTGGLSGTLTLINVARGMDFTLNAEALDGLASRPYFRAPSDGYPDFNAAEIDPVSVVATADSTYRSLWSRGVDAVSAVLMRSSALAEYTLDVPTFSVTDVVLTLPTRHFYATATGASAPFTARATWEPACIAASSTGGMESLNVTVFNRDEFVSSLGGIDFAVLPGGYAPVGLCASAGVASVRNYALPQMISAALATAYVLGSVTHGMPGSGSGAFVLTSSLSFDHGWLQIAPSQPGAARDGLSSKPESSRLRHSSGDVSFGAHKFLGLPMLGFSARMFRNGTLRCDAGACQGNYGGAFPMTYRRSITVN